MAVYQRNKPVQFFVTALLRITVPVDIFAVFAQDRAQRLQFQPVHLERNDPGDIRHIQTGHEQHLAIQLAQTGKKIGLSLHRFLVHHRIPVLLCVVIHIVDDKQVVFVHVGIQFPEHIINDPSHRAGDFLSVLLLGKCHRGHIPRQRIHRKAGHAARVKGIVHLRTGIVPLPFVPQQRYQLGFADAGKAVQHQFSLGPQLCFDFFDIFIASQHLVAVQLQKAKTHLPSGRLDLAVQLHDLFHHFLHGAALFRLYFCRAGKDLIQTFLHRRCELRVVDAAGIERRGFQLLLKIRIPALPQCLQNVLIQQAVHQLAHCVNVCLGGQALLTAALQLRGGKARGRHDRLFAERRGFPVHQCAGAAKINEHGVQNVCALIIHCQKHIAQVDISMQVARLMNLCKQDQQTPDQHQRHLQRRHCQHRLAVRLQIAQGGFFALFLSGFPQDIL